MKRLAASVFALLFVFPLAGCDSIGFGDDPAAVFLRVENTSSTDFSSVHVSFPGQEASYGTVSIEQTSADTVSSPLLTATVLLRLRLAAVPTGFSRLITWERSRWRAGVTRTNSIP